MNSTAVNSIAIEAVAVQVTVKDQMISIILHDDRIISFPAHKFSRLASAEEKDLQSVRIRAQGTALRWDVLDEDLLVDGIVKGIFEKD